MLYGRYVCHDAAAAAAAGLYVFEKGSWTESRSLDTNIHWHRGRRIVRAGPPYHNERKACTACCCKCLRSPSLVWSSLRVHPTLFRKLSIVTRTDISWELIRWEQPFCSRCRKLLPYARWRYVLSLYTTTVHRTYTEICNRHWLGRWTLEVFRSLFAVVVVIVIIMRQRRWRWRTVSMCAFSMMAAHRRAFDSVLICRYALK